MKEAEECELVSAVIISEKEYGKYFLNEIRRIYARENDYGIYVIEEIDNDLLLLEIDIDYPLSEGELLSYIRSDMRDKKIDKILECLEELKSKI